MIEVGQHSAVARLGLAPRRSRRRTRAVEDLVVPLLQCLDVRLGHLDLAALVVLLRAHLDPPQVLLPALDCQLDL
eukprot:5153987-Alexandrium_andersonii.AAC.1